MEKGSIAVIGNCYFDEIYSIDEFPEKDTKSIATSLKISLGGSATNTAAGLAALGVSTYLFTALGDDPDALRLFKKVRKKGILTQYITHLKGKSGRTIILLDNSKSSTKIGYQGVCSDLSESLMYEGLSNPIFDHIHLSSVSVATITRALQFKGEKTISLDMGAKTLQATDQELHDVFANINLVFLNGPTFERLFKADPSTVGSFKLPCDVVVTAGTAGIYASINGQTAHQEIIPTEVVDTTGAGDAVAAAILFGLRQNSPLQEVLWMGVKAASVKIQAFGGAAVLASQKDLLR